MPYLNSNTTRHEASYNLVRTVTDQRLYVIKLAVNALDYAHRQQGGVAQAPQPAQPSYAPELNNTNTVPHESDVYTPAAAPETPINTSVIATNQASTPHLDASAARSDVLAAYDNPETESPRHAPVA